MVTTSARVLGCAWRIARVVADRSCQDAYVHQDEIRAPTLAQADCFRVARRFGLHIDPRVALEHATQAFAVKLVVIRDQQAYWVDNCQWPHMSIGAHVHGL